MKIFVTILVAATMASAKPDISSKSAFYYNNNYNNIVQDYYMQQQQQQQQQQQLQYNNQNIIPNSFFKINTQYLPQRQPQPPLPLQNNQMYFRQQQQQRYPMPSDYPSMYDMQPVVKPARRYRPRTRIPKKVIVTKNFYIHTAPEETHSEIEEDLAELQEQPRKHYNVLFIRTPSQTNKAVALNLARSLTEEKTVVYVLAKKTSAADLHEAIQESPPPNSKPEVFFIKYRTPAEAANAQRQIQSQYDSLGGSTTISDEGIVPATSVIGSLDPSEEEDEDEEEELEQQQQQQQHQRSLDNSQEQMNRSDNYDEPSSSSNNGYLPPSNR